MIDQPLSHIVIVGGGTAGWMTAAALSKLLDQQKTTITLIESDLIGTIGVGEATLPHLRFFNQKLGIEEKEFMHETQATFKLGIEFSHWGGLGDAYIHPFGDYGQRINDIPFYQYWLRQHQQNPDIKIDDYSMGVMLAQNERFLFPSDDPRSIASTYSYAYHIDASLYAKFLRGFAEKNSVVRVEGKVVNVGQAENGDIEKVFLDSGESIGGDFFVDCSGFRALLIGQTLKGRFESWKHWLPCDSAVAVPCDRQHSALPYTKAIAHDAGWRWQIPLQHRTGNGIVYSSEFKSAEVAETSLMQSIDGPSTASPNHLKFEAGTQKQHWLRNCVAIGLSSGFLEPLESTSIYLIQSAIMKLVEFLPGKNNVAQIRREFNRQMTLEMLRIRDFLILHYHITERNDSDFWHYCKTMAIPDSLSQKIDLFRATGHIESYQHGLFLQPSWLAVYLGQRTYPKKTNRIVAGIDMSKLNALCAQIRQSIQRHVSLAPNHQIFLEKMASAEGNFSGGNTAQMSLYGNRS